MYISVTFWNNDILWKFWQIGHKLIKSVRLFTLNKNITKIPQRDVNIISIKSKGIDGKGAVN